MAAPAPSDRPGHRRMRSLLRNYYGIGGEQEPQNVDPMSLDSTAFDKDKFIQKELKTKKLDTLRSTQSRLQKECDQLDGEMKTLVYENYNKFISATDTIQQMKTHITEMEEKMNELRSKISGISTTTKTLSQDFSENRKDIEKYSGIYSLLKKREFLFELPSRLNKCIEEQAHTLAVKYYNSSKEVLDRYKHLPSFNSIYKECITIVENLKELIHKRMSQPAAQAKTVTECTNLLLDLGENSASLQSKYLDWYVKELQGELGQFKNIPSIQQIETPSITSSQSLNKEQDKPEAEEELSSLTHNTNSHTHAAISELDDEPDIHEIHDKEKKDLHRKSVVLFLKQLSDAFLKKLLEFIYAFNHLFVERVDVRADGARQARLALLRDLDTHLDSLFDSFSEIVRDTLFSLSDPKGIIECLELVEDSFTQAAKEAEGIDLREKADVVVVATVRSYLEKVQKESKSKINETLTQLQELLAASTFIAHDVLDRLAHDVVLSFVAIINSSLLFFDVESKHFLAAHGLSFHKDLTELLQDLCSYLVSRGSQYALQLTEARQHSLRGSSRRSSLEPSSLDVSPLFLCLLARFTYVVEKQMQEPLTKKIETINKYLTRNFRPDMLKRITVSTESEIQTKLESSGQKLLQSFVRDQGTHLSLLMQKGVETPDWETMREPQSVRPVIELISDEFRTISQKVAHIFQSSTNEPSTPVHSSHEHHSHHSRASNYPKVGQHSILGTVFERKQPIIGVIDSNSNSILSSISKIALKSFVEAIRLRTFSKFGFQQVQVDVHYLRTVWGRLNFDERLIERLLEEVLDSTSWRCVEPVSMEQRIIESICAPKFEKLAQQAE